jgi:hypothetical protein
MQSDVYTHWEALGLLLPGNEFVWAVGAAADLEGDAQVQPGPIVVRHHHPDA